MNKNINLTTNICSSKRKLMERKYPSSKYSRNYFITLTNKKMSSCFP